jgi:HSP20 family molecular chaperone IbpA
MKKDSETQFIVVVLAPGLVDDQIQASVDFIKEGEKPVLLISVQSGQSADSDLPYGYNNFQQYILLPEDVELSTRVIKMQNGLFTCSFQRVKPIS